LAAGLTAGGYAMRLLLPLLLYALAQPALAAPHEPPPAPWAWPATEPARGPLFMVTAAEASVDETEPRSLTLRVKVVAYYPGTTNLVLQPLAVLSPPADGIYDALLLGTPPMALAMAAPDNVAVEARWRLRELPAAIRIHAEQNCLLLLLAASAPPGATDCEVVRPAGQP
jgi:hypothetical protein